MILHVLRPFKLRAPSYSSIDTNPDLRLSPENGNVAFASTDMHWCFTLRSFAQMYAEAYGKPFIVGISTSLWLNRRF
jgi:116 kDa U5 small nuclear ribonucleoprotein component